MPPQREPVFSTRPGPASQSSVDAAAAVEAGTFHRASLRPRAEGLAGLLGNLAVALRMLSAGPADRDGNRACGVVAGGVGVGRARVWREEIRFENPKLLLNLGVCLAIAGKSERARAALALAREAFEARCDHFHLGRVFDTLARLAKHQGDVVSTRRCVGSAMSHKHDCPRLRRRLLQR